MKEISLTQGKYALVDDEDFEWLNQWKWHVNTRGYVIRKVKDKSERMHKILMNPPKELETDHINRNKLDNQKGNLRVVSHTINLWNSGLSKHNKSGFKGVCWYKSHKKWAAGLHFNGKQHRSFWNSKIAAALAYKLMEKLYRGSETRMAI